MKLTITRAPRRNLHVSRMTIVWEWVRETLAALACLGMMFGGVIVAGLLA